MNRIFILFLLIITSLNAQSSKDLDEQKKVNPNFYLEDQLYVGVTYNILTNLPNSVRQSGFSNSLFFGFIKDLPTNKERNFGFGVGLGYGLDTYFQNMKVYENGNETLFENFQEDESFKNNKLVFHSIEAPLEIRFRTSSLEKYKFWRVYTGIKLKYIFNSKATYKNDGTQKVNNLENLRKFNYGLTLGAGNGTWNIHLYYGLKSIFTDAYFNGDEQIKMKDFKIGLIFYIL